MLSAVCFLDTETTGLDPERHEIWEVGLITPDGEEHHWFLPVDEARADLIALNIGGYFDRHDADAVTELGPFCRQFQRLTRGRHLAGAVVSFDADRLARLMIDHRVIPAWHYHLIDVETLAVGYLARCEEVVAASLAPPWDSTELSKVLSVDPAGFERHTALGDARWAKALYEKVMS